MTRDEAARVAEEVTGARVAETALNGDVLVLWCRDGQDGASYRLAVDIRHAAAENWTWPERATA